MTEVAGVERQPEVEIIRANGSREWVGAKTLIDALNKARRMLRDGDKIGAGRVPG